MKCIICESSMSFFFSKYFSFCDLGQVEYWKCTFCGFTASKTHYELPSHEWRKLNLAYHEVFLGQSQNDDDPRWLDRLTCQARVINDLAIQSVLPSKSWLDYSCGDGKLSDILRNEYNLSLLNYEKFAMARQDYLDEKELIPGGFDFVITTSVFEHMTSRTELDDVAMLVSEDGIMGLHTLVCEEIPNDPDWFYLLPVHCSFFTNKCMDILLDQWGYKSSIYSVDARLWLFFKSKNDNIKSMIENANLRRSSDLKYLYSSGFLDYWK